VGGVRAGGLTLAVEDLQRIFQKGASIIFIALDIERLEKRRTDRRAIY